MMCSLQFYMVQTRLSMCQENTSFTFTKRNAVLFVLMVAFSREQISMMDSQRQNQSVPFTYPSPSLSPSICLILNTTTNDISTRVSLKSCGTEVAASQKKKRGKGKITVDRLSNLVLWHAHVFVTSSGSLSSPLDPFLKQAYSNSCMTPNMVPIPFGI